MPYSGSCSDIPLLSPFGLRVCGGERAGELSGYVWVVDGKWVSVCVRVCMCEGFVSVSFDESLLLASQQSLPLVLIFRFVILSVLSLPRSLRIKSKT